MLQGLVGILLHPNAQETPRIASYWSLDKSWLLPINRWRSPDLVSVGCLTILQSVTVRPISSRFEYKAKKWKTKKKESEQSPQTNKQQ